jgi:hypothetical protein
LLFVGVLDQTGYYGVVVSSKAVLFSNPHQKEMHGEYCRRISKKTRIMRFFGTAFKNRDFQAVL